MCTHTHIYTQNKWYVLWRKSRVRLWRGPRVCVSGWLLYGDWPRKASGKMISEGSGIKWSSFWEDDCAGQREEQGLHLCIPRLQIEGNIRRPPLNASLLWPLGDAELQCPSVRGNAPDPHASSWEIDRVGITGPQTWPGTRLASMSGSCTLT